MDRQAIIKARAQRAQSFPGEIPGGKLRMRSFSGGLQHRLINKDGRQVYHVDGFATVFERGYEMWDAFGTYKETMDQTSLDKSLSAGPDVAFLVNHKGVTMARTTNGSLVLQKATNDDGYQGLHIDGYLNPDRQDVRDLMSAIDDKLIDEMSFAFMLLDGTWNDDYTEFRITEADIDRGDVSAVNYGANPFTSIQARAGDWLRDAEKVPAPVAQAAMQKFIGRKDSKNIFDESAEALIREMQNRYQTVARMAKEMQEERDGKPAPDPALVARDTGKPVYLWQTLLDELKKD